MSSNHGANLFNLSSTLGFSKNQLLDFSSNINPFGSSEKGKKAIIDNIDMVSIYPDPEYKELKKSISDYCKCITDNIILGSGATELISSFIDIANPKRTLLIVPAYSEYENELNKRGTFIYKYKAEQFKDFKIDIKDLKSTIDNGDFDLVIICNPNNPTGFAFTNEEISLLIKDSKSLFMVDETYIEFTDMNVYSSTSLVNEYDNLFVIRGTSKFFSTPGIRLGYGLISNEKIRESITKRLDLWNINILATLMGEKMFADKEYINSTIEKIQEERTYLAKELRSISGIKVYNSKGNFILCKIENKKITATELYNSLMAKKIIIRNCKSFEGLDEYYFRVCILKPEENRYLIDNLKIILE